MLSNDFYNAVSLLHEGLVDDRFKTEKILEPRKILKLDSEDEKGTKEDRPKFSTAQYHLNHG